VSSVLITHRVAPAPSTGGHRTSQHTGSAANPIQYLALVYPVAVPARARVYFYISHT
jgi:hypothetical protein